MNAALWQGFYDDVTRPVDHGVVADEVAAIMTRMFGHVPLNVRYAAARAAIFIVEEDRREHAAYLLDSRIEDGA